MPVARSVKYGNASFELIRDRSMFVFNVLSIHLCEFDSIAGCSEIVTGVCLRRGRWNNEEKVESEYLEGSVCWLAMPYLTIFRGYTVNSKHAQD
jgi:hypothetical protein